MNRDEIVTIVIVAPGPNVATLVYALGCNWLDTVRDMLPSLRPGTFFTVTHPISARFSWHHLCAARAPRAKRAA